MSNWIRLLIVSLHLAYATNQQGVLQVHCPNGNISLYSNIAKAHIRLGEHADQPNRDGEVECEFVLEINTIEVPTCIIVMITADMKNDCKFRSKLSVYLLDSTQFNFNLCKKEDILFCTKSGKLKFKLKTKGEYANLRLTDILDKKETAGEKSASADKVGLNVSVAAGVIIIIVVVIVAVVVIRQRRSTRPPSNAGVVQNSAYSEGLDQLEDRKGQEDKGDNEYTYIDGNLYTQSPRAADPTVYEVVCDKSRPLQLSATQSPPDDPIYFGEQRDETYQLAEQDDTTLNRSDVVPQGKTTPTVYRVVDEQRQSHTYVTGLDDRDEGHVYSELRNSVTKESKGGKQLTNDKEEDSEDEPQYHVLDNTTEERDLQSANGSGSNVERDDSEYHELEVPAPTDTEQTTWCENDCYDGMRDAPTTNKSVPLNSSDNVPVEESHDYAVLETPHTSDMQSTDDPVERDDSEYHELEVTTSADTEQTTWCENDCNDKMRDTPTTNESGPINNSDNVPVDDSPDYAVLETPRTIDK